MLQEKPLLVLDVDEVQVYSTEEPIPGREADFRFGKMHVHKRPHLEQFLRMCSEHYLLAHWSAAEQDYVNCVLANIMPAGLQTVFVNTRQQCLPRYDENMMAYNIKDLNTLKDRYSLDRMLIVEDNVHNCERNPQNAIIVKHYRGEKEDKELLLLGQYLVANATAQNFRKMEKKNWRKTVVA